MEDPTSFKGTQVLVEFAAEPGRKQVSITSGEQLAEKSARALDGAMNTIEHMVRRVTAKMASLPKRPTDVEVQFGLKLDSEAGALIARIVRIRGHYVRSETVGAS